MKTDKFDSLSVFSAPLWFCRRPAVALLLSLLSGLLVPGLALAHPLGNFTVNRYSRVEVGPRAITVRYALDLAEIPTFQAMTFLDPSGDGVVTDAAKASYASERLAQIVPNLRLTIGGQALPLRVTSSDVQLRPGQGSLPTLWLGATLVAATPDGLAMAGAAGLPLTFRDDNEPDRIGWREIVVRGIDGVSAVNSTVAPADQSDELRNYPANLLARPLDERTASATVIAPAIGSGTPAGAVAPNGAANAIPRGPGQLVGDAAARLVALPGGSSASSAAPTTGPDTAPGLIGTILGQATSLSEIVAAGKLGPLAIALAFLLAALWGAAHAFTPGHGKTIVAAYLVGSRGTARHALYLGLTVTATHTLGIYLLGLLTLVAARFILPESLYPWLALVSGLAVVAVGIVTAISRTRALRGGEAEPGHHHDHDHSHDHWHARANGHDHAQHQHVVHEHVLASGTDHPPAIDCAHAIATGSDPTPSLPADGEGVGAPPSGVHPGFPPSTEGREGGRSPVPDHEHVHQHGDGHPHDHRHLPPGADGAPVTWRSLLALGVAGGILPCPSALVLFLGATALGQIAFGLALVAAFSVGLAGVLVGVGIAFVYARQMLSARGPALGPRLGPVLRLAPIGSAILIALLGLGMTAEALGQLGAFGRL